MVGSLVWITVAICSVTAMEHYEEVSLEEISPRPFARGVQVKLHETLTFNLKRQGKPGYTILNLQENKRLNQQAPMFEVRDVGGQSELVQTKHIPLQNVKFYHDVSNRAAVQAECITIDRGYCRKSLHGSLYLDGAAYEIMPALEVTKQRSYTDATLVPHVLVKVDKEQIARTLGASRVVTKGYNDAKRPPNKKPFKGQMIKKEYNDAKLPPNRKQYTDTLRGNLDLEIKRRTFISRTKSLITHSHGNDGFRSQLADILFPKHTSEKERTINDLKKIPKRPLQDNMQGLLRKLKELIVLNGKRMQHEKVGRSKRQAKTEYAIEILVVLDPTIWERYYSMAEAGEGMTRDQATEYSLRRHFSHIINGLSLRYEEIVDAEIGMYATISGFLNYKRMSTTTPLASSVPVTERNGVQYVNSDTYIYGLPDWLQRLEQSTTALPSNDHVMVFTRYDLYGGSIAEGRGVVGVAFLDGICSHLRTSVQEDKPFYQTVTTAAHELGHNLGAPHDGSATTIDCPADEKYLMRPYVTVFGRDDDYTVNPWLFSNCSVNAFKQTIERLGSRNCLADKGSYFDEAEYVLHTQNFPGQLYTLDEQCKLAFGDSSGLCNSDPHSERICINMGCRNTVEGRCELQTAAAGTACGNPADGKWCMRGACVKADSAITPTPRASTVIPTTKSSTQGPSTRTPTHAPTTRSPTHAPTTKASTVPPTTVNECSDKGYQGVPCSQIDEYFTGEGYSKSEWCQWFESECCVTCAGGRSTQAPTTQAATEVPTTHGECSDSGYQGYTCAQIQDYFSGEGYTRSQWCQWYNVECCITCTGDGQHSCTDVGYAGYTCQGLDEYYTNAGYTTAQWCPYYETECCNFCNSQQSHCVDEGYAGYTCLEIQEYYANEGYTTAQWCPYYEEECCDFCHGYI